jgi:DNA invertase Pin-like site-specific DNA recombinase
MSKRAHTLEQIIQKLREAEVELAQGATVGAVRRKLGVTDQTYYRWWAGYGGIVTPRRQLPQDAQKVQSGVPGPPGPR